MLAGSVERVIASHWLLRLLKRMRVSELILRRRQQSYTVVTQVSGGRIVKPVYSDHLWAAKKVDFVGSE